MDFERQQRYHFSQSMIEPPPQVTTDDLKRQREEIRRSLVRVNTALLAIVTVVIGLALAGIFAAYRANERRAEATAATQEAQEQLWKSYLSQATAGRLSTTPGRKGGGLQIIEAAARIRPSVELRNEDIAHLALIDLASDHQEEFPENCQHWTCASDLTQCALVDSTGRIEVQALPEHRKLVQWQPSGADVSMLMFSPGNRYLMVAYRSGGFQVLDVQTGSATLKQPPFRAIDFSSDGAIIGLLVDPKRLEFVEGGSGRPAREALSLPEPARDLAFDLGGHKLALNLGSTVEVWDWQRGEKLATLEHDNPVFSMSWSAQQLAVGDELGGIRVWDTTSFRPVTWIGHKSLIDTVLFNHRGDLLVSDSWDGTCKVWNPRTGHLLLTTRRGFGFSFSADDTRLAYSVRTSSRGRWGWWELSMPQGLRTFDCLGSGNPNACQIDFSPNGKQLAVLKNDELRILDLSSGRPLLVEPVKNGRSAYFLAGGNALLICTNNRASVCALQGAAEAGSNLRLGQPRAVAAINAGHLDAVWLSQDKRRIAFLKNDSDMALVDLETSDHCVTFSGGDKPAGPALSPDGKWLVSGTFHGRGSTIWDAATGQKVLELDRGNSNPFFSPDGRLLVSAGDREYRVYECPSWKLRYSIATDSAIDLPNYAAFSGDGTLLAIVKEMQFVQLIEPRDGGLVASLVAPEPQTITWLTFSPDGKSLAAGTTAGLAQVWDLATIHRHLGSIGLDWDGAKPASEKPALRGAVAHRSNLSLASARFVGPALAGVGLVVFCAWFVLRRQGQLFASYLRIDDLMEQRNRELKVAHTELMHGQKMKALGTLAAGIAHDFNNLLSVIRMSNKLIGREVKGNPEVEENVEEVEEAVQQGKHIVASMLGFSKEQKPGIDGKLFLPDLVEDTVGLLSRQFLSGITLDLELDRESPAVSLQPARLEQILLNLIVNAAEAMEGKGHLRIQVRSRTSGACQVRVPRPAPKYIELVVADTGCGIEPEILPRIFDPFFTTKSSGTNRGTGLGLSMIYAIAEQDGLGIGVESTPGKGATFRLVIPLDESAGSKSK